VVSAFGRSVAQVLQPPRILIGTDTRASRARIQAALSLSLSRDGVEVEALGVLPTPAIAFSAARAGTPALVVSASHNPWSDNGIKVIGPDGYKLPVDVEAAIERAGAEPSLQSVRAESHDFVADRESSDAYVAHLLGALEGRSLDGMRVVIDCANGAASTFGLRVFRDAGAEVFAIHDEPDGRNINADCGSTHPESLQAEVRARGAALGLALDGDADRVLAVDETGALVDGDQIMTMTALDMHERAALPADTVVVTVMSNLGLRERLRAAGITVLETPVGDRQVVAEMRACGAGIGGEQSGHIVYAQYATTGDGLLTGLLVCDLVKRSGTPLSMLAAQMERWPQLLVNVRVSTRVNLQDASAIQDCVRAVEADLGDAGRVLVRASGTEPLVRIMVEAHTQSVAEPALERLRSVVEAEFGSQTGP
jgi:phosphoglucosamine mutase